jgi:hypothetical protein
MKRLYYRHRLCYEHDMPKLVSKEERLERLIAKTRSRIDAKPEAARSLSHGPDSLLGTLVSEAGCAHLNEAARDVEKADA